MLDLTTIGHTVFAYLSTEKIAYKFTPATEKINSKGEKIYTAVRNKEEQEISIRWHDSEVGQHLTLWKNDSLGATFTLTNDKKMVWLPQEVYSMDEDTIAKPSNPKNSPIVSTSLYEFFQMWLNSKPFSLYLDSLSREQVYPPSLVKLLLLFISYLNVRTKTAAALGGKLTEDLDSKIDNRQVAKIFNILLSQVVGDTPHMIRMYSDASTYLLPAGTKIETATNKPEPQEVTLTPLPENPIVEGVLEVEPTIEVQATEPEKVETLTTNDTHNPDDVDLTDIMRAVKEIENKKK